PRHRGGRNRRTADWERCGTWTVSEEGAGPDSNRPPPPAPASAHADLAHLVHVGDAGEHFFDAVLAQRAHAFGERLAENLLDPAALLDQALDRVRTGHQLVQADAALVALGAVRAADRTVEREAPVPVGGFGAPAGDDAGARGVGVGA